MVAQCNRKIEMYVTLIAKNTTALPENDALVYLAVDRDLVGLK